MPKYMVWVGAQGSSYVSVMAETPEEARTLAQKHVEEHDIPADLTLDFFIGEAELVDAQSLE